MRLGFPQSTCRTSAQSVAGYRMMPNILQFIAVVSASLFSGAALYINVAEHPARMRLDTSSAARQWAPSYKRATLLQAPLAIVSFLAGAAAWLVGVGIFMAHCVGLTSGCSSKTRATERGRKVA